jgi:enoyl-CoA hydratase/carnithine racemase
LHRRYPGGRTQAAREVSTMTLLADRVDAGVLTIEISRAERGNALSCALQMELAETWERFESDDRLSVAVLKGAPEVFSIGHDVAELAADASVSPVAEVSMFPLHLSKPVIAAIDGPCYGLGFELALACDLRVAGDGALFGFADPHLFVPYRVASVLLPRMTFLGESLDLLFSGRILDAAKMRELGLVSERTAKGCAGLRASEIAHDMVRRLGGHGGFRKQAIWRLSGIPLPAAMQFARASQ